MYKFEHDWFGRNIGNLETIFRSYQGTEPPKILEIGAFEGRSTVWFFDNLPGCKVTTMDTWQGGKEHLPTNRAINFTRVKNNFYHNTEKFKDRLEVFESTSFEALMKLIIRGEDFDFVYIDGSHEAIDVNLDLVLSFKLLKTPSVIYCDDYYWGFNEMSIYDTPKLGIDSFVNVYGNKLMPIIELSSIAAVYMKVAK